jgi:hypothetical protein
MTEVHSSDPYTPAPSGLCRTCGSVPPGHSTDRHLAEERMRRFRGWRVRVHGAPFARYADEDCWASANEWVGFGSPPAPINRRERAVSLIRLCRKWVKQNDVSWTFDLVRVFRARGK